MTAINSDTETIINNSTHASLVKFGSLLNPENSQLNKLNGFQIYHHDGFAGCLFSLTILTEFDCISLLLRESSDIQVFHANLIDQVELNEYLFDLIHQEKDSLFGFPLVQGPTTFHTLQGVSVALLQQIRPELFYQIRINLASLMSKESFEQIAIGILPRLNEMVEIISTENLKRTCD